MPTWLNKGEIKKIKNKKLDTRQDISVTCIHGDTHLYPTALVSIQTEDGLLDYEVGVVPKMPYDVILGRDFPNFAKLGHKNGIFENPTTLTKQEEAWGLQPKPRKEKVSQGPTSQVLVGENEEEVASSITSSLVLVGPGLIWMQRTTI